MKIERRWLARLGCLFLVLAIYPAWVLGYTWMHVLRSDLEGGRHGPLDAYRHALASAIVSHTFGEGAVDVISKFMEREGDLSNRMDCHNNRVGARIGRQAKSLGEIDGLVREKVKCGEMGSSDPERITWLPEIVWKDERLW